MREAELFEARERRKRENLRRQQHEEDVRAVMGSPAGRRFLWYLLDEVAGVFSPSFAGDALVTAHNEGRRAVGISIMVEAQRLAKDSYAQLLAEQLTATEFPSKPRAPSEDEEEYP